MEKLSSAFKDSAIKVMKSVIYLFVILFIYSSKQFLAMVKYSTSPTKKIIKLSILKKEKTLSELCFFL